MKLKHMEMHALSNRPELIENHYEERISIAETKAGIRSILPGINFNAAWTSSSNDYLMNKTNLEYGSSVGANLLNVFRAPKLKEVNEMNTQIIQEQRLALSMAVLSQVHISNIEYQMALDDYETADRYYDVSKKITEQVRNAQEIARFGELELIREEASLLVAELRRDIAFSRVQFSVAQVYTSVGIDVTTKGDMQIGTKDFANLIKQKYIDTGKKFKAIVRKPINKQKPIISNNKDEEFARDIENISKLELPITLIFNKSQLSKEIFTRAINISLELGIENFQFGDGFGQYLGVNEIKEIMHLLGKNNFIKIVGGIKTISHVKDTLEAGADCIGTSYYHDIFQELKNQ